MNNNQIAQQRLYLTAGRDKLVPEGSKAAAFLYAAAGDEIPASAAKRFGIKGGKLPTNKGGQAPANKGGQAPANKGAGQ